MRHFVSIEQLTFSDLTHLLERAQTLSVGTNLKLSNNVITTAFFENSTRTRCSFEVAAKRCGIDVVNFMPSHSSLAKGETINDTLDNLLAMGIDGLVLRHNDPSLAIDYASKQHSCAVINAGGGTLHHPSQTLLDCLTIKQTQASFTRLNVVIVGDSRHSRVAHSLVMGLRLLGCQQITFVGPPQLTSSHFADVGCTDKLEASLRDADVIVALRIQQERLQNLPIDIEDYISRYQLNLKRLSLAKSGAVVMHPGPVNQNIEISSEVLSLPNCLIRQQVSNGVFARMAILEYCLH